MAMLNKDNNPWLGLASYEYEDAYRFFGREKELEKLRKKTEPDLERINALTEELKKCHNYIFVGKCGAFCPMVDGCGAGELVRDNHGKFVSATGAKGYRWMEAEVVKQTGKEQFINLDFYKELANKAASTISKFGDFEAFTD